MLAEHHYTSGSVWLQVLMIPEVLTQRVRSSSVAVGASVDSLDVFRISRVTSRDQGRR